MEYTELRKGNLIYFPFIKENVEVIGINALWGNPYFNKLSVKNGLDLHYESIDIFKPIPLTEEWILKFKYIKLNNSFFTIKGHLIWRINDLIMCDKNGIVLKYVHQLQNLYFALTGQELKINQ